ncbi:hypothetical protein BDR05DRAFT_742670 [Suillus weaverae]|nr:hypothetical protein BDR05DRAFT_742670 [Suillus weaverae]
MLNYDQYMNVQISTYRTWSTCLSSALYLDVSIISPCAVWSRSSLDPTLSSLMEPLYLICTTMSSPSHAIPGLVPTGSSTSQHSTRSLHYLCSFNTNVNLYTYLYCVKAQ